MHTHNNNSASLKERMQKNYIYAQKKESNDDVTKREKKENTRGEKKILNELNGEKYNKIEARD